MWSYRNLQNTHKSNYQEFFAKNDIVVSGWFFVNLWTYDIGHRSSSIRTALKLPLKWYVWLRKTDNMDFKIWTVKCYNWIINSFVESNLSNDEKRIKNFVLEFLKKNNINKWLEISILSELWRWHWLGFSWNVSTLISICLHIVVNKLSIELLQNYDEFVKSPIFQDVFLLWWKLQLLMRNRYRIGDEQIMVLLNTNAPIAYMCEHFTREIEIETIDKLKYKYFTIKDILKDNYIDIDVPFDYGIIYQWVQYNTDQIDNYRKLDQKRSNQYEKFLRDELLTWDSSYEDFYVNKFIKKDSIYNSFSDLVPLTNIFTLKLLKSIYEVWYDPYILDKFIDSINYWYYATSIVEGENEFVESFKFNFRKNKQSISEKLGIISLHSSSVWSCYLVVTKQWISRDTISDTINNMKQYYPNLFVDYLSYEDWATRDGVILEQYVSKGITTQYTDKKYTLKSNSGEWSIWEYEDLMSNTQYDILLDKVNKKLYIKWQKMGSKEIASQSTTIELLDLLLNNMWEYVSCDKLPVSSYSKLRNQMAGKIIQPLVKIVKTKIWKDLPLICKWSLTNFNLKLDKSDIKISWIEKI